MTGRALVCLFLVLSFAPLSAWKNPRQSHTLNTPVFGTHDWIAFKGYVLAGRPAFIKDNLNRFFIGTEAPDNGFNPRTPMAVTTTPPLATTSCSMRTGT